MFFLFLRWFEGNFQYTGCEVFHLMKRTTPSHQANRASSVAHIMKLSQFH